METRATYKTRPARKSRAPRLGSGRHGKYNAAKTVVDNITFDSRHESERYSELRLLQLAGEIEGLELQPEFEIVVNGKRICKYRADFRYRDVAKDEVIVEDSKGYRTPVYRLKKKLVEAIYEFKIIEM